MINESLFETNSNSEQPEAQIGSQLKRAREKLDLTIIDIARQLRLKPERIDELEKDEYQAMPGITFTKGYLRAYAQLVNLPADDIIALFDQLTPSTKIRTIPLVAKLHTNSLQEKPTRWGLYLVGLALVVLMAIWWNSFSGNDAVTNANAGLPRQPLPNEPITPTPTPSPHTVQPAQTPIPQAPQGPTMHTDMAHAGGGMGMPSNNQTSHNQTSTTEKTPNSTDQSDTATLSDSQNAASTENTEPPKASKKASKKSKRKRYDDTQYENTADPIDNDLPSRTADNFE